MAEPGPLGGVVIRACDRPEQLAALLRTLVQYERRYGARRHYVVLDDSHEARSARRNAALLDDFTVETAAPTTHVDHVRWTAAVERLVARLPDAARALDFAVARRDPDGRPRPGGGKGFNLAGLLCAGRRYVLLDEDNLLPLKCRDDADHGLEVRWSAESDVRLFDDADDALAAGSELEEDPFEHALALCGRPLGDVLASRPELAFVDPAAPADQLAPARVVTVTHGHRGDSCSHTSHWLYFLRGEAREAFWRDEARYRRNLERPSVWYGTRRAFLQPYANFTPFAVDATVLLPPTMPDGRGEDVLFGYLIGLVDPESLALHSNLTIGHRQEGNRGRMALLHAPALPVFNNFVVAQLGGLIDELTEPDPLRRIALIAGRLRETAAESNDTFGELLAAHLAQVRSGLVEILDSALQSAPEAPRYWLDDVQSMLDVNRAALVQPPPPRFLDWPDTVGADACAERVRRRLEAFAATLEAWPAIWEHARTDSL